MHMLDYIYTNKTFMHTHKINLKKKKDITIPFGNDFFGASEMDQHVWALATKPDKLSSLVEGENLL